MIKNIPWAPPQIGKDEQEAIEQVMKSDWLSQGTQTELFEKKIAKFTNAKYAVVTNNGTSSLIAALLAHNIKPGDEVIVPSLTFVSSVNAILAVGAKPVLADCDTNTFNTNVKLIKNLVTKKTKAVMPVDVSGMPIDVKEFQDYCAENNLILIEDAAEALGAEYKKKKIGSFGHSTIFSFHMAKVVAGIEGGCIVTNDKTIAEKLKLIRSHGDTGDYNSTLFGLNFRISDIHAALALAQLKQIKQFLKHRQNLAKIYKDELHNFEFQLIPDYVTLHPYMLFAILLDSKKRNSLRKFLSKNGIDTRICWPPIHKQPFHSNLFRDQKLPNSEKIFSKILNLPMGNGLTETNIHHVAKMINKYLK